MADQITESFTSERTVRAWGSDKENFKRNLAVFIGIDRYEKDPAIRNLTTAVRDANAIADLLQKDYDYKPDDVIRLKDKEATLDALQHLFDTRIQEELNPGEDDRLIIYFAGHGLARSSNDKDGPEGYLVPHDADPTNDRSFLAMRKVYNALEKLKCHHLLVILDCCFAGTFRWAGSRKSIPILETIHQEHYYHFIRHPAWQVITSSAHDQEALDVARLKEDNRQPSQWNELHSPFALALLQGLKPGDNPQRVQADLFPDGVVTAHELFVYLQTRVKQLSSDQQAPGIYPLRREYDRGEFVFTSSKFDPKQLDEALPLNEDNNPYRGLNSFDEKHADFFFGRQALVDKLADRLSKHDQALTVVLGISGSGKSSLVKAGLLPYLRSQKRDQQPGQESNQWYILDPMRPGELPFISLARVLLPLANAELLEQVAQMDFLDKLFQPMLEVRTRAKQNSASMAQNPQEQTDETLIKVADSWCNAKPEAKLLLIEDYFTQLDVLLEKSGNSQQRKRLKDLYDRILAEIDSVSKQLEQEQQYFSYLLATWSQQHSGVRLILVIDQFEELLTRSQDDRESSNQSDQQGKHSTDQKEWQKFLERLRIAIENHPQTLRLVLTLRSDFEPRFLSSALEEYWKNARFPVRAMTSDELRQAIENPALKQAIYFEELKDDRGNTTGNLVSKLVDEVGQMPGALPLLSFTLSELYVSLYKRWQDPTYNGRTLLFEDYKSLGGVAGALTRRATKEYEVLDEKHQATMRRVMLRMVAIEGGGIARRRVPESELIYSTYEENERVQLVIGQLVNARLLMKGQEIGEPYVEPAHDLLVRGWDKLQIWIKESQEDLLLLQRLIIAVGDWVSNHRSELFLWNSDPRIDLLEEILESEGHWLNKAELEFLIASLSQQDNELSKTREQLRISEERRIEAEIREQTALLVPQVSEQPLDTLVSALQLIGLSTNKFSGEPFAPLQAVFHKSLVVSGEQNILPATDAMKLVISSDGKYILQYGGFFKLNLFEWNGNLIREFSLEEFSKSEGRLINIFVAVFSHDGQHIICSDSDGFTYIWDFRANLIRSQFKPDAFELGITIAASPINEAIAVAGLLSIDDSFEHLVIGIFDWQGNPMNIPFPAHQDIITTIAFSPDRKYILSGSKDRTVCLWDFQGNLMMKPLEVLHSHGDKIKTVLFDQRGEKIISVDSHEILIWNRQGRLLSQPLTSFSNSKDRYISITSNGEKILVVEEEGSVYLLNWQGNILNYRSKFDVSADDIISNEDFLAIAHPTEPFFITNGQLLSGFPKVWDLRDDFIQEIKIGDNIYSLTSASQNFFAIISSKEELQLRSWDGKLAQSFPLEFSNSASSCISSNGELIAIFDGCLKLWNYHGELIRTMGEKCSADLSLVGFVSDEQILTVYSDSETKSKVTFTKWSIEGDFLSQFIYEDKEISDLDSRFWSRAMQLVASSDCRYVCITLKKQYAHLASMNEVKIVDTETNIVSTLANYHPLGDGVAHSTIFPESITVAAFCPDGNSIATIAGDCTLQKWSYTGEPLGKSLPLQGCASVTFSSDGKYIATAGQGIYIYDSKGSPISSFLDSTSKMGSKYYSAFDPDNQVLVVGNSNGTLRFYRTHWKLWLQLACDRLRFHPIFKQPQTEVAQQACETCIEQIWNGAELLEFFVARGNSNLEARNLATSALLKKGGKLARIGKIEATIAAYTQAQELDPSIKIPAKNWGELAWFGGLYGYASNPAIKSACEKAIGIDSTRGAWRDSRGLVRAINGDIKGAIDDFQAFIEWTSDRAQKRQFQRWLNELRTGMNPFTNNELERIKELVKLEKLTGLDKN